MKVMCLTVRGFTDVWSEFAKYGRNKICCEKSTDTVVVAQ